MEKWQAQITRKNIERARLATLCALLIPSRTPTALAEQAKLREWRPDPRIARGSPNTKTKRAHLFCSGDGQCGTTSHAHCGGRRFAALTNINFCKGDASLKVALGQKRQARIKARGW